MKKGIVRGEGTNGIKILGGNGKQVGNKFYKYEIKIKGQYGDYRVYGNYDEKTNQIIFEAFGRGH